MKSKRSSTRRRGTASPFRNSEAKVRLNSPIQLTGATLSKDGVGLCAWPGRGAFTIPLLVAESPAADWQRRQASLEAIVSHNLGG
jgi:hypothetical protein